MTNLELQQYYANLLVLQYLGQDTAYDTIEAVVAGPIMNQLPLAVEMGFVIGDTVIDGVLYPGAVGVQLDILGKYAGVTRNGFDLAGNPVTLNDMDFTTLIKLATVTNSAGSSLATIQALLHQYFANQIFVYDGADMQLSYLISSSVGNQSLIELFVTEGLLPKPMGVQLAEIIYIPIVSLFGFQTYDTVAPAYSPVTTYSLGNRVQDTNGVVYSSMINGNVGNPTTDTAAWQALIFPMNTYDTYPTYEPYTWLTYDDGVAV